MVAEEKITHALFCWIGIIEANDHLSVVHFGKVSIENSSFRVPNMQITRRLWWKAGNNTSVDGILQSQSKSRGGLVGACFVSFCTR